jgi:hypothetical protein
MRIQAKPGETIDHFALRLIEEAKTVRETACGIFNGTLVLANPESFYEDIVTIWSLHREAGR